MLARAQAGLERAWPPLAVLVVLVIAWQAAVTTTDVSPRLFAGPTAVWQAFVEELRGPLLGALGESMTALAYGLGLGIGVGLVFGFAIGVSPRLNSIVSPYLWAVFATPDIAIAPLAILWFGLGNGAKVLMAFISVVIPVSLNCKEGVEAVDRDLMEVAYSFGGRRRDLYRKVVAPLIVPAMATGIRNGLSRGFVSVLVVEMLTGTGGLGTEVIFALSAFDSAEMLAYVLFLVGLALVLISGSRAVESRFSRWRDEVAV